MPKKKKRAINQIEQEKNIEIKNQINQKTKRGIAALVSFLTVPCLALTFNIGRSFYSFWIIVHRTQIIGILLLAIITVIISSPLIVEVNTNPRPLSGPGKNPKYSNLP